MAVLAAIAGLAPALAWRQMGPASAGGRVAAVAGSDRNPLLYYFGAAGGGVFKTKNGGLTWQDVWPRSAVNAIGAIAIAPSNPNVVYVGTGESTPRNDASYGDGVWLTRDGGKNWSWRGLPQSYAISRILIDPRDPNHAIAGALGNIFHDSPQRGVYVTRDGGKTWQQTLYAGPQSGISDLAWNPHRPNVIYAGVYQFRRVPWSFSSGGPIDGIYKSIDGGVTWRRLRGHGLPPGIVGRIGLAVAPSDPRRVYSLIQSKAGLLWRSDDAGAHWRRMSGDTLIDQRPFYMSRLAVDPIDEDHVFFASENLIETRDGGRTFTDVHDAVHQDHHGFWISRDGRRIIEADDGGAPISLDGGGTWDWRFNVTIAQTYHIGYDNKNPYHVCGAFQDNDSFCGPSQSLSPLGITAGDWRDVANNADGVAVWPDPVNPRQIWNVGINELNGQLGIFDLLSRQNYDVTPDVTDTNGRALAGLRYRFNWEAPLAFSPQHLGTVYFGANVVFASSDRGRTWKAISPDLTRNDPTKQHVAGGPINTDVSGAEFYDTLLSIAPSPVDAQTMWAGTDDGLIQRTIDGGAHWRNVTPRGLPPWGRVETIEPSHASAARAYAVVNRRLLGDPQPYMFVTDDGGTTWRRIDAGLPRAQYAHVVREDPFDPNLLYAGLEQGAWVSFDRGAHWESLRLNMPAVAIYDLQVQPRERDLIAGTHGRGLYILDDLRPLENASAQPQTQLFAPRAAYTWYLWWARQYGTHDDECCVPSGAYSGEDPPYGALISYELASRSVAPPQIEILDASGTIVRTFAGTGSAGLNRVAWDLGTQAPVRWSRARDWNQPPLSGPTVIPGAYTVRLRAGSRTYEQPLRVAADPRASWTQAQYEARFAFLRELDDELSNVDAALNRLDALRAHASPALRRRIAVVYGELTSGVVNAEDDQWMPDRLRERITILQGTVALSQGPPLPPHLREAAAVRAAYEKAMRAYRSLLEDTR